MRSSTIMLGAVLGSVACTGADKDSGVDGNSDLGYYPSTLSPGATISLSRCTQGVAEANIDETLAIVFDMEQSYHEMIGCGGMVVILASTRRPSPTASASGQLRASCNCYAHMVGKIDPHHQAPRAGQPPRHTNGKQHSAGKCN